MTSIGCGGVLPPPTHRWERVDQLAAAMFHRDHPVGVFTGQGNYLRIAYFTVKHRDNPRDPYTLAELRSCTGPPPEPSTPSPGTATGNSTLP